MQRISVSLFFLFIFGLSSCGKFSRQEGSFTGVRFSVVSGDSPGALLPGIMVYAVRVDDIRSRGARFISNETVKVDWLVPNGVYHFYGVAYSGSSMTGTMYCGRANQIALTGGNVTIPLDLRSTSQCGTGPFAPPSYNVPPNPDQTRLLYVGFCAPTGGDISLTNAFGSDCDAAGGRPAAGSATRIRISLEEYARWDPNAPPEPKAGSLSSGCIPGAALGGSPVNTNIRVPYGDPFVLTIEAHNNTTCAAFNGSYTMVNGLAQSDQNSKVRFRNAAGVLYSPSLQMMQPTIGSTSIYFFIRN